MTICDEEQKLPCGRTSGQLEQVRNGIRQGSSVVPCTFQTPFSLKQRTPALRKNSHETASKACLSRHSKAPNSVDSTLRIIRGGQQHVV